MTRTERAPSGTERAPSVERLVELRKRARTPEQQRRFEQVQARNRAIQEAKPAPPKSGIYGRPSFAA